MARYSVGGKRTVESCRSIDALDWHWRDYFRSPQWFSWAWTRNGQQMAFINVETERHSVTLRYRSRSYGEDWTDVEQCVAIAWTPCRFGGEGPWFICSAYGRGCGRQVVKLYGAGQSFACRHCYRLGYASQQESAHRRGLGKAQKIRMQLGGSSNMLESFPEKPRGMHWRTYERFRRVHGAAQARFIPGMMAHVKLLGTRRNRRA